MKKGSAIAYLITVGSLLLASAGIAAEPASFSKFPAAKTVETCKEADFSSYFRAHDAKKHLIKDNPERSRPNYGGKYLLLKQELLMETLWLIVDCETGKFYKDHLKGVAEFNPKSLLIVLSKPKSNDPPQYQVWSGEEWSRVDVEESEESKKARTAQDGDSEPRLQNPAAYLPLFKKYPTTVEAACHDLDYNSYFRAQSAKNNLIKLNPERTKPNFAGKYLLLKNDVLFERFWLIADCATGKFLPEIIKGNLEFKPDSHLILVKHSAEYIRLSLWRDERFVDLLNPVRPGKQEVENKVYDQEAKDLMLAAGASGRESKISFEDLRCAGQNCSVKIFPDKTPRVLTAEQSRLAESILKKWGAEFQEGATGAIAIEEGKCTRQRNNPICEIKLSR